MQNNMYRYYNVNSVIHNINPVSKLLSLIFLIITLFLSDSVLSLLIVTLVSTIYLLLTNVPYEVYFKHIKSFIIFVSLIVIMLIILKFEFLTIIKVSIKLCLLFINILILLFTTPNKKIYLGLNKIIPFSKLNYHITKFFFKIQNLYDQYDKISNELVNRNVSITFYKKIKLSLRHAIYNSDRKEERINLNKDYDMKIKFNLNDFVLILVFIFIMIVILVKEVRL